MPKINWKRPIEAVLAGYGNVEPLTVKGVVEGVGIVTNECPDIFTTNNFWNFDGSDFISSSGWSIRNVAENEQD